MVVFDRSVEAQAMQHALFDKEAEASLDSLTKLLTRYDGLSKEKGAKRSELGFGPTYYLRTSGGMDLSIRSIFAEVNSIPKSYVLVATTAEGVVVGYRDNRVYEVENGNLSSSGFIFSAIRKKGIATAIDSVHKDFLQRIANQYGRKVIWKTLNGNAGKIYLEEKKIKEKKPDAISPAELAERKVEQSRWQSLWGARGKFGMGSDGFMVIPKQISRLTGERMEKDLQGIEAIYMSRDDQGLFKPVEIERAVSAEERSELLARKAEAMQDYLEKGSFEW